MQNAIPSTNEWKLLTASHRGCFQSWSTKVHEVAATRRGSIYSLSLAYYGPREVECHVALRRLSRDSGFAVREKALQVIEKLRAMRLAQLADRFKNLGDGEKGESVSATKSRSS